MYAATVHSGFVIRVQALYVKKTPHRHRKSKFFVKICYGHSRSTDRSQVVLSTLGFYLMLET